VVRVERPNLPYLFSKLTLDFFTFFATAPAKVAVSERDIYHSTENFTSYRTVYDTCGASWCEQVFFVRERRPHEWNLP
jgi:hypothetical protein